MTLGPAARFAGFICATLVLATPVRAGEASDAAAVEGWIVCFGPQLVHSTPVGSFDAPPRHSPVFAGLRVSAMPPGFPVGLRAEAGGTSQRAGAHHVRLVSDFFGMGDTTLVDAGRPGNGMLWISAGALWDPRPRAHGLYAWGTVGAMQVVPRGYQNVFPSDRPSTPPARSTRLMTCAGAGAHFVLGKKRWFALMIECEYRRTARADYIGRSGFLSADPDAPFDARHGPIELVSTRIGLGAYDF